MKRFCRESTEHGIAASIIIFLTVLFMFLHAVGEMSEQTLTEQQENLEAAVEKSLLQCYVTEGRYPEDFDYLQEHYGVVYDEEQFRVDYRIYGTNMRPEIEVLVLEETR